MLPGVPLGAAPRSIHRNNRTWGGTWQCATISIAKREHLPARGD
jgi:hypothetical protein